MGKWPNRERRRRRKQFFCVLFSKSVNLFKTFSLLLVERTERKKRNRKRRETETKEREEKLFKTFSFLLIEKNKERRESGKREREEEEKRERKREKKKEKKPGSLSFLSFLLSFNFSKAETLKSFFKSIFSLPSNNLSFFPLQNTTKRKRKRKRKKTISKLLLFTIPKRTQKKPKKVFSLSFSFLSYSFWFIGVEKDFFSFF